MMGPNNVSEYLYKDYLTGHVQVGESTDYKKGNHSFFAFRLLRKDIFGNSCVHVCTKYKICNTLEDQLCVFVL